MEGTRKGKVTKFAQFENREIVWFDQDVNTTFETFSTGPQVFHMVHWNMLMREKMAKIYHLMGYTASSFEISA